MAPSYSHTTPHHSTTYYHRHTHHTTPPPSTTSLTWRCAISASKIITLSLALLLCNVITTHAASTHTRMRRDLGSTADCIDLLGYSGEFTSPGYDGTNDYEPYTEACWRISVEQGELLTVTFSDFDLEYDSQCTWDYLEVYELYRGEDADPVETYCGTVLPPAYTIDSNTDVIFKMYADSLYHALGFRATYEIIGEITDNNIRLVMGPSSSIGTLEIRHAGRWGYVSDESYSDQAASVACRSLGLGENGRAIWDSNYKFTSSGSSPTIPLFMSSCQGDEVSTDDCYNLISYQTGGVQCGSIAYGGLRLVGGSNEREGRLEVQYGGVWGTVCATSWSSPDSVVACRELGFAGGSRENIQEYGEGSGMIWLSGMRCDDDDPTLDDCGSYDDVGKNRCTHDNDVAISCDRPAPSACDGNPCNSNGACSPSGNSYSCSCYEGWTGDDCDEEDSSREDECVRLVGSGDIQLPDPWNNYDTYPREHDACWVLEATADRFVSLKFRQFEVEEGGQDCEYDYLSVYDGEGLEARQLEVLCGDKNDVPAVITSSGRYLYLAFHSDNYVEKTGFDLQFSSSSGDCVELEDEGVITSPNYPDDYDEDLDMCWIITARSSNMMVRLDFDSDFRLETDCDDSLTIYHGDEEIEEQRIGTYCGTDAPAPIISMNDVLLMRFRTNGNREYEGFSVRYSSVREAPLERRCGVPVIQPVFPAQDGTGRIVGGSIAVPHSWPWQVNLNYNTHHICGGSIISERYVITAAHCLSSSVSVSRYTVTIGNHNRQLTEEYERIIPVREIHIHPNYSPFDYDIAILELEDEMEYSDHVKPVCVPEEDDVALPDDVTYITGWGDTFGTSDSSKLNQIQVPVIDTNVCNGRAWYDGGVTSRMVCAGLPSGGKDSCQGDSGGPLTIQRGDQYVLHGITSWGDLCAAAKKPGVYSRVSVLIGWVEDTIGAENFSRADPDLRRK